MSETDKRLRYVEVRRDQHKSKLAAQIEHLQRRLGQVLVNLNTDNFGGVNARGEVGQMGTEVDRLCATYMELRILANDLKQIDP